MSSNNSIAKPFLSYNFIFLTCQYQKDAYANCIKSLPNPNTLEDLNKNKITHNCNELKEDYIRCLREFSYKHIR